MRRYAAQPTVNPYIALTDLSINLMLIFLLCIPLLMLLGSRGWDNVRYRDYHEKIARAVRQAFMGDTAPRQMNRNDAPGEQRWIFAGSLLFGEGENSVRLSEEGKRRLRKFAAMLTAHPELWHRLRIEGHARYEGGRASRRREAAGFELSAARAVAVAGFLYEKCRIRPNEMSISGRGHQDLLDRAHPDAAVNDRVDLLVIPPSR